MKTKSKAGKPKKLEIFLVDDCYLDMQTALTRKAIHEHIDKVLDGLRSAKIKECRHEKIYVSYYPLTQKQLDALPSL